MYDFIGIGAGPANLSLAAQAFESREQDELNFLLVEKKSEVRWHPGMLLPGSRLDTHFAKDLITMLDPTSSFTFLNFLSEKDRLVDFLNCGTSHPYRHEFDEYIGWAAGKLSKYIACGHEVLNIDKLKTGGFCVSCKLVDGGNAELLTRNIVIGAGGKAKYICDLPPQSKNIIHSSNFLDQVVEIPRISEKHRVLVVGSGQSAAEVIQYLLQNTHCELHVSLSDFALLAKEGTAFINESYNGKFVDRFFELTPDMKTWFKSQRANMNYGVVDSELIGSLYNEHYFHKYYKHRTINFRSFTRVTDIISSSNSVTVKLENKEKKCTTKEEFDTVVLATGYEPAFGLPMISHLLEIQPPVEEAISINRDFSIANLRKDIHGLIFLNGNVSDSHGPAEDVLSVISHRSRDIFSAIRTNKLVLKKDFEPHDNTLGTYTA